MSIQGTNLFYGSFVSDGKAKDLKFGTTITSFEMRNLTQFNATSDPGVLKRAWFSATQPNGSYFGVVNTNGAATDQSIYATTNGFTPIDYNNLPTFSPTTIASVSQANPAVVTANGHGLSSGDTVIITNVTGMQQISGITYTVTVTGANTFTIPVDASGFAAAGSGGQVRKIFLSAFEKRVACIVNVTQASSGGVVTTTTDHGFEVGDVVSFSFPSNGAYGMKELNSMRTQVIAVGSTTTFTIKTDTSGFAPWQWPTSADAFMQKHPSVFPAGSAGTLPNYLGGASQNVGFKGLTLGSAVCGSASDVIHWVASVGTTIT